MSADTADEPVVEETGPPARLRHVIEGAARVMIGNSSVTVFDAQGNDLFTALARRAKDGGFQQLEIDIGGGDDWERLDVHALRRLPAALAYLSGESNVLT